MTRIRYTQRHDAVITYTPNEVVEEFKRILVYRRSHLWQAYEHLGHDDDGTLIAGCKLQAVMR